MTINSPITRQRRERESGAVTIVAASIMVFACIVCLVSVDLGRALAARARAQTAADAAALAAAEELAVPRGDDPAAVAARFAELNGATLRSCECAKGSDEAVVEVVLTASFVLLGPDRSVTARARAVIGTP